MNRVVLLFLLFAVGGCAGGAKPVSVGADHPANPDAAQAPLPPPSNTLAADEQPTTAQSTHVVYTCPMHPDVTSDHPGECPKCGMTLVEKEAKP